MNYKALIMSMILPFLFTAAKGQVADNELSGVWLSDSKYGEMKTEIFSWKGKSHAYLLHFDDGKTVYKGSRKEEHIFLIDLEFVDGIWKNGTMYLDENSDLTCGISIEMLDENTLKVTYDWQGYKETETWMRL